MNEKMYLTEYLPSLEDDVQHFGLIVIFAPTGSGKTTLLLNAISDKPVLYLVNRQALNMDVQHRLEYDRQLESEPRADLKMSHLTLTRK